MTQTHATTVQLPGTHTTTDATFNWCYVHT